MCAFKTSNRPNPDHVSGADKREDDTLLVTLIGLDPSTVVEGVRSKNGFVGADVAFAGKMREICPVCMNTNLQLVLRQVSVKRSHMFCPQCTRCFDAIYADGTTALALA